MKYFSMFSGIGGFELGIQRACDKQLATFIKDGKGWNGNADEVEHDVLLTSRTTPLCVGYSEIDKYAIKVYERHYGNEDKSDREYWERTRSPECLRPIGNSTDSKGDARKGDESATWSRQKGHRNYGDATTINPTDLPDFDLLVGGFPCQAFSIAGKRHGFNDTRGTLFFDIARILAEKRPRHLVLENVKGLLSHDSGKTFQTILGVLSDMGYRVEWQVLNSKDFGVPQNRERIYFVGHLRGECSGEVLPISNTHRQATEPVQGHYTNTITARYEGGQATGSYIIESELNAQEIVQINKPTHSNDRVYSDQGISPTLNTMQGGNRQPFISKEAKVRRLTPLECERLQGFPDDWTAGESDTQRYKMCGNAVTVNVVEAVITNLIKHTED